MGAARVRVGTSPDVVLAAIAGQTERVRLGTGVTVLSSDDPVRVYERFATLDAVSHGRAEVTLGRGSFIESFPLFGYSLDDYELLFAEKLDLFTKLLEEKPVYWQGETRPPLEGLQAFPHTESGQLSTWIGVGGTPQSVVRAATYGLPLVLAVIGGSPARFSPLVELYHRALAEAGKPTLPAWAVRTLGLSRFQLEYAVGDLSHERRLESIRIYGDEVIPRVRELLSTAPTG
jgi:alkanesulfonate monooxygenase SsuD/methylene tetrahydromethanopterin reductase-like flavin-dependent oxidoreductase (luciferase family)